MLNGADITFGCIRFMVIIMKFLYIAMLLVFTQQSYSNSSMPLSSQEINFMGSVYDFFTSKNLYVGAIEANSIYAENQQNCNADSGSTCQSFAGGVGIQTSMNGDKAFEHKIIAVVEGQGNISSYAQQTVNIQNGEKAQNCAATACIMISEKGK